MPAPASCRRRTLALVAALTLGAALSGCAVGRLRPADVSLPQAYEAKTAASTAAEADLDRWWKLYNDAQLDDLVRQALASSPDARDAAAKLEQARAIRSAALDAYNPQGQAAASITRQQLGLLESEPAFVNSLGSTALLGGGLGGEGSGLGGGSLGSTGFTTLGASQTEQAGFQVSWEADLFDRRGSARKSANADLRAAEFNAAATRWSLAAEVANDLFQARGLALQLAEANETLNDEQQLLDVAKAKVEHGLSPGSDQAQTESNYLAAKAQQESLGAQLDAARRSLLVLIGKGTQPLASLTVTTDLGAPPPIPAALPGELLVRRPDVQAAHQQVLSASGKLSLDQKALLPTIQLQPGIGLLQETASAASRLSFWSIGANVAQPVLDVPRLLSQIRVQKAIGEQAVIAYEKAVQTAYGDAENAFTYFASDTRRLDLLKGAEAAADRSYQAKLIGYRRGLNDLTATLTAEASWREARVSRAQAETTLMQRSVQVFKALGGGWTMPGQPAPVTASAGAAG